MIYKLGVIKYTNEVLALTRFVILLLVVLSVHGNAEDVQRGTLKVNDHCSVALDGGKVEGIVVLDGDGREPPQHPRGKDWDFWFDASSLGLFLNPQNRAMFATVGTSEAGKSGCQAAAYKRNRLRIDKLPAGSHICVLTSHLKYAELTIVNSAKAPLEFAYTLWEPSAPPPSAPPTPR